MSATDRLAEEIAFHDRQAWERAARFGPADLLVDDDWYLDHETWIRPAFDLLGSVAGLRVLDLGCGHGMASVVLARRGASVVATDLSGGYLIEATRRALVNQVDVEVIQADAHRLPFANESFDRIWGNAILHHLELETAASEVQRLLKPDGVAVFCEPWGENPLLDLARRLLPYPGKERTPDERPLRQRDIKRLRVTFPHLTVRGFQLLGMARRVIGSGRLADGLTWCDDQLLRRVPGLARFCRYVVIGLGKQAAHKSGSL